MNKFTQDPTFYPIPIGLGVVCPQESCSHGVANYCFNPLATFYTNTTEDEEYHYLHPVRSTMAKKLLVANTAFYHRKDSELYDREYLVAKYYSLTNELITESGDRFPRDQYTFHGYTDTPVIDKSRVRYAASYRPGQKSKSIDRYAPNTDFDFDF